MEFVAAVYRLSSTWPTCELYGLVAQIRRAAVSVPSNIAEGQGRSSIKEFMHRLSIAYGSLMETETQLLIARELGYSEQASVEGLLSLVCEVGRLLNGLRRSLSAG